MSTTNQVLTIHRRSASSWSRVKQRITEWRFRARSRCELMNLDDKCLRDIGMSRCTADFEAAKPFWMV
jgi:uncharacterized protein YjiS (DUF1127 family)